jgi:hypothetical protein
MLKYNTFSAFIGIKMASYLGNAGKINLSVSVCRDLSIRPVFPLDIIEF